jgi:release factor glutamine methyltransferase
MSPAPLTISQARQHARQRGLDRLDAQLIVCAVLDQTHAWLLAHDRDTLAPTDQARIEDWVQRRAQGEPLAYILGDKEFFGLTLAVSPQVLIPRPDTETLVEWALDLLHGTTGPAAPNALQSSRQAAPTRVLDLGTGSGAIALAIAHACPQAQLTAVDASEGALLVAQSNARRLDLNLRFVHGNWLQPLAGERFELIVSNPPYIAEGDPHLAALGHEPISALTAGPDGLDDIRTIIQQAPAHLTPGGWLLFEHGWDQAVAVAQLLANQGFANVSTRFDLGGQPRCTGAQMRG